ncbi:MULTISPECIES: amidohydrolase [Bacillaceae]|uniref:Amidohydrolase n=1 Tax=Evansella alkalicola TaxID=745819 RepID=A0ABS6K1T0_9BACI|nr:MULTISPECIES: amidohydrolase [Bacillaceae]MBU9723869.1 amidohydrolase [Bacillus alkalicola]
MKLIKNGYVLTMNADKEIFEHGDVLVDGSVLKEIGQINEADYPGAEVIDAEGKIVMPGLVNTHVHLNQQLGRGIADDVDLLTWLRERIWPYESNMTEEDVYVSALACCAELIRSGVTTFAEAGGHGIDAMAKAITESGLRGILSRSTMDSGEGLPASWVEPTDVCLQKQVDHYHKWNNTVDGRIRYWFNIRTIFNATDELLVETKKLADQFNAGIHMHIAEIEDEVQLVKDTRGATTAEHLGNLGVLGKNLLSVHTVYMSELELNLYQEHGVKVSHNPGAAMKVLGFPKIPEMLEKGICVAIGTDGAPANNRMDMFQEMHLTSLIHKGRLADPQVVPAYQVLEMATRNGAQALLWEDEIGSLEVGKKADLIIVNPDDFGSLPLHNPVGNLVYSMSSSRVESSMCNGQWVMKGRKLVHIDENVLIEQMKKHGREIIERAGIVL